MDNTDKSVLSMTIFLIVVLVIGIAGYFLVIKTRDKNENNKPVIEEKLQDYSVIKIDDSKEFIYQENFEIVSEELEIIYSDIRINVNSTKARELETKLNSEKTSLKQSVKYISQTDVNEEDLLYSVDDIYSASVRHYETYNYEKYLTLVVNDHMYYSTGGADQQTVNAYTFNLETGFLLTLDEILEIYTVSRTSLIRRITENLQTIYNASPEVINFDASVAAINELTNVSVYIDENGKLKANYVVITNENTYNETVEIA